MHHVVIIGAGFGGLQAAKQLAGQQVRITLLDRCNHHLFQPLLYQVATAGLSAPSIAAPIRHILRKQDNVTVLLHNVCGIDCQAKQVIIEGANAISYDSLIVAAGATHSYLGHDHWSRDAPGLKTLTDAMNIRRRSLLAYEMAERNPELADEWLRFIVIGGGPTGIEMAGTLAEIAHHTLPRQFRRIEPSRADIVLVEAGSRILSSYPEDLSRSALSQIGSLGVNVMLGHPVTDIDDTGVTVGGQRIRARTVIWAAGVQASPLGAMIGGSVDRAGRVIVNNDLTVNGFDNVYVIGDLAAAKSGGDDVPGVSPAAKQMGALAAQNVLATIGGNARRSFAYKDYGSMATIGRRRAVAQIGRVKLRGLPAWVFWLFVHLFFLIGFRNRFTVMTDWAMAYFTFNRSARIVWDESDGPTRSKMQTKPTD